MAGGWILPGPVHAAYDGLFGSFDNASGLANCGAVRWFPRFIKNAMGNVEFSAFVHAANCKARGSEFSILLHVQEEISPTPLPASADKPKPQLGLIKSTIQVGYYHIDGNEATLIQSIHYDYGKVSNYHPVFHAQYCTDDIVFNAQVAAALEFEYQKQATTATCFRECRIPTSDMTFPSVLLCIAADHFHASFLPFMESVRDLQDKMPLPSFDRTKSSITATPDHIRSSHWFAHMQ